MRNFKKEMQEKIYQFQKQVAIKKKQLFEGLLPVRFKQFVQF